MFSRPTYIVLDLPDAVSREIQQIRKDLDPERANLNAEISLIGSSGVGVISPGQPFRRVFNEVDRVAAEFEPFTTGFIGVDCFAGTGICFFVMDNFEIFNNIHRRLGEADIHYEPVRFPYQPHCTLTLLDNPLSVQEVEKIKAVPVPTIKFLITTMSVYSINPDGTEPVMRHSAKLGGF